MTHPYIPNAEPGVRAEMLAAIGASSVEDFYADIPADLRLDRPLDLPAPFTAERDLVRHMKGLFGRNTDTEEERRAVRADQDPSASCGAVVIAQH